jgi:nickel transport protein
MIRRLLTLMGIVFIPSIAFAHGLGVDAKRVGDAIRVVVVFDTDDPADDCEIVVVKWNGQIVITGKTDAKGEFTFPAPEPGEYRITADAGSGHKAKVTITITPTEALSNQPSREQFTGSVKWLWAITGLFLIASGTVLWKWFAAKRRAA